jgi:hypothetical protein
MYTVEFVNRKVYIFTTSEVEMQQLQTSLDNKRRVDLLLGVLEEKEKVRVRRFKEMMRLLNDLR